MRGTTNPKFTFYTFHCNVSASSTTTLLVLLAVLLPACR